jgi:hypothetical protein
LLDDLERLAQSKLRYNAVCFWLYADPPVLHSRLNARVDEMIEVCGFAKNFAVVVVEDSFADWVVGGGGRPSESTVPCR